MERMTPERLRRAKDELFRALQTKTPLRQFLQIAHEATGLQFSLCSASFAVLAAYPDMDDEKNLVTSGGRQYVRFGAAMELEERQHMKRLLESARPSVSTDPRFLYPILFQSIRINQAMVAYIFSPGRPEGFYPEELELVEYLSQVLSIEMQKQDFFAPESGLKYEYFLLELLESRLKSESSAVQRLHQLGRRPQPYYYLAELTFDDVSSRPSGGFFFDQVLSLFPDSLVGLIKGRMCMLLPRGQIGALTPWEESALKSFLEFNHMRASFSDRFTALLAAPYAWEQARRTAAEAPGEERVRYYDQVRLYHLLDQIGDAELLRSMLHPDIELLRRYDGEHNTHYLDTLWAYLRANRNAAQAAAALFIHKSTFFFRMGKIAELVGDDVMRDGERLFAYELSLRLLEYLQRESSQAH